MAHGSRNLTKANNSKEIIDINKIENGKVKEPINTFTQLTYSSCLANTETLSSKQV